MPKQPCCSEAEWAARVDLAACYRLVELYGMADMMANHISSRVPGEDGAFLINPYGMLYEEITASRMAGAAEKARPAGSGLPALSDAPAAPRPACAAYRNSLR